MTRFLFRPFFLASFFASLICTVNAGQIVESDGSGGGVDQGSVNDGSYDHLYNDCVGPLYGTTVETMVESFHLPYLAPGQQVTAASISFFLEQKNGAPSCNVQLYGLNRVSTTTGVPIQADYYTGASDTANTLLSATFATPSSTANQACTYSGANLVNFVQKQYANSAFSGMDLSNSRLIFFRLNPDNGSQGSYNNYQFGTNRNPNRTFHPMLTLTISNGISNVAGRLQFSFSLPKTSTTSAGIYDATGKLIRTLWNNVQYAQGTSYGVWDGKDDNGTAVTAGTNYRIKLIYHNVQYIWDGVVGNTSTNETGNIYRSFGTMIDMAIGGGTGYITSGYDENQDPIATFQVGNPQLPAPLNLGGWNLADVTSAFTFLAADSSRTYLAKGFGGYGGLNTYVIAMTNSGTQHAFYTFPKGTTPTNSDVYKSCIDFDSTPNQPNPASGLAVQQAGNAIFVAHSNLNIVRVFDKVQGNLLGSFAVQNPGRMAVTANGDVWVICNTAKTVQRYTFANGTATLKQTITGLSAPAGVAVSSDHSLVLVADGGASEQIKAYNNTSGASVWTYGTLGGMNVNGPAINTSTFQFNNTINNAPDNEAFMAFQADNTFWISDGGNGRALHFSISGNTLSYIEQIAYRPISYQSTVDLTDATRVFNGFIEYSVNYALPLGGTNGSWTLAKNWWYGLPSDSTHNYFGYEQGWLNVVTLTNGRTYGFLQNYATGLSDLFELPANGPVRATGYSYNNTPRIYQDGTLRFNTPGSSNISFYSAPLTGFDAAGNPSWGSPALVATTATSGSDPLTWSAYAERTEITASGVVVDYDGFQGRNGYHLGGIQSGGTAWQWRSSPSVNGLPWFPQDGRFDIGDGVQYAGNVHMALGRNIVCGYHGEFWKGGEASQWMNFLDNGLEVGRFGTYGNAGTTGSAVAGFAGNSFCPTLVHAPDGNTYLYHNDESNHGGTLRWQITGWDGIQEEDGTGAVGGTANLSPNGAGPTVLITSPTAGATYLNGHNLILAAEASGSGANITSVQFFDGSTSLGSVTTAPYNINYVGLSPGTHVITAKATDSNSVSTTSAAVSITVGADGTNSVPPAPISLSSGSIGTQSVSLNWTQPVMSSTSSTIGQILSFSCDSTSDSNALTPTSVAGAPPYAAAHFNLLGQGSVPDAVENFTNSLGLTVSNVGVGYQTVYSSGESAVTPFSGTAKSLFSGEVSTAYNTVTAVTIRNIPYAFYDLVVYSLPYSTGTQVGSITVNDNIKTSVVQQSFTAFTSNYTIANVPFGTSTTVTNVNTIVLQGLTSPTFKLQGNSIAAFQIVERPYDQGTPTSYSIERALGTSGSFTAVGTTAGPASSFTDTTGLSPGTTYQYRIKALNSAGSSAYSNTLTITTTSTNTAVAAPAGSFSTWQSKNFTTAQLADSTFSGPNADPYGSGVENLMAYALQLDPATARPSDVPTPVITNGHLTITYLVPAAIPDVNFVVEVSPDLKTWGTGAGYTQVISSVSGAGGTVMTVQDTLPTTTAKHFMHLRVTQTP